MFMKFYITVQYSSRIRVYLADGAEVEWNEDLSPESRASVIRRNWRKNRGHFINPSRADERNDLVERVRRNTWSSINLKYAVSEGIILDKEPPETCEFGYP